MRCSLNDAVFRVACAFVLCCGSLPLAFGQADLMVNGGFERHNGMGAIPTGWHVIDENFEYFGWIAPRVERKVGGIRPRSGKSMIALDTEMMGVNSNGKEFHIPRSAIYQTIRVPAGTIGVFSIYYNDLGSSALSHISAIRLAYTINHTEISTIQVPDRSGLKQKQRPEPLGPNVWSRAFFRVSQSLPFSQTAIGDWSLASIPVHALTPETDGDSSDAVQLTLWIGIFDLQNSTELGYWRVDDASFVVDPPTTRPAE